VIHGHQIYIPNESLYTPLLGKLNLREDSVYQDSKCEMSLILRAIDWKFQSIKSSS